MGVLWVLLLCGLCYAGCMGSCRYGVAWCHVGMFRVWCCDVPLDPYTCPLPRLFEFLDSLLVLGLAPSTCKVFASVLSVAGALLRTVLRWAALCVARAVGHGLS